MRYMIALLALATAGMVTAEDITVNLGSITIPDAAVDDVKTWLDTQKTYSTTNVTEIRTDPDTGLEFTNSTPVKVEIEETYVEKLQRISTKAVKAKIRAEVLQLRQK